jgi:hypothetical protein
MNPTHLTKKVSWIVLGIHRRHGGSLTVLNLQWALLHPELGLDSLDLAEIMATLEAEFGLSPFERGTPKTWGDVVSLLSSELSKSS